MRRTYQENRTVCGLVTPCAWNKNGDVVCVTLATVGEREYLVREGPRAKELLELIAQWVEVCGQVTFEEDGKLSITVRTIKWVDSAYGQ